MKKSAWFLALIGLAISACTTQKQATSYSNDDVYGKPASYGSTQVATSQPNEKGTQVITAPDNASVSKPASSTFADDYNDYSYSSRIQKFNSTDTTKGYFDDSYTSSASQSGGNGSDPNVNIYLGFGAGFGGYYGSSFGLGWGYPYSSWGWDYGWWNPYSSWGWGYPYYGYNPWYNPCCYCYGYNDWYGGGYTPYYSTNTYYGSRQSLYRSDNGASALNARTTRDAMNASLSPNTRSQTSPAYTKSDRSASGNVQPAPRATPASQEKYRFTRTESQKQAPNQRTTQNNQRQSQVPRTQPAPRYVKPENAAAQRSGSPQSYSSPVYRQPKTSQEYLAPRSQTQGNVRTNGNETRNTGTAGSGTIDNRRTSTSTEINRSGSNGGRTRTSGYSEPVRSNNNVSSPTRSGNSGSYSAPRRSEGSGNYSAPDRSGGNNTSAPSGGGNYSAPSRSSGSGSSGGSGGSSPSSGGGGGRRR
ncbi:MAG: hypothetical protein WCP32_02710 [Bacteroidota bacterium]